MYITYKRRKCTLNINPFTQLSELLNMTNGKQIFVRDDVLLDPQQRNIWSTDFVGPQREIDFDTFTGMPKHFTKAETIALFRAIKNDTTIGRNDATPHVSEV